MALSSKSSLTLSIHLNRCLPLLLSPLTCPGSAASFSFFPSILSTCSNHSSLLLLNFSITVSSAPSSSLVFSLLIFSLLLHAFNPFQPRHLLTVAFRLFDRRGRPNRWHIQQH